MEVFGTSEGNVRYRLGLTVSVALLSITLVGLFFYFDRKGDISMLIRTWGTWGILISIAVMAFLSIVPIPGEFLLVLNMKVYGVLLGAFYAWIGAVIGALVTFIIARHLGAPLIRRSVSDESWLKVESWVQRSSTFGLLIARLLPLPVPIVNYVAGFIDSISFWNYMWTAAVSIWPYYICAACLFVGIPNRLSPWMALGIALLIVLWLFGFILNRRSKLGRGTEQSRARKSRAN